MLSVPLAPFFFGGGSVLVGTRAMLPRCESESEDGGKSCSVPGAGALSRRLNLSNSDRLPPEVGAVADLGVPESRVNSLLMLGVGLDGRGVSVDLEVMAELIAGGNV